MEHKKLPGSELEIAKFERDVSDTVLGHIFSAGNIVMSQVCTVTGLEPYIVQNWVKRGFVAKPEHKTYRKNQLCRILIINMLRDSIQIDEIINLLSYINGALDDESDDRIGDAELYNLFVNLLVTLGGARSDALISEKAAEVVPAGLDPTTKKYVAQVLGIMAYAYFSAELRHNAQDAIKALD